MLLTDSQVMISIFSQKHLSPCQSRWMLFLGQFPIKIEHISDKMNVIADLLSRILEYSGYINGSLRESVNIDISDQYFESSEFLSLVTVPIILRREKILLETSVIHRRRGS